MAFVINRLSDEFARPQLDAPLQLPPASPLPLQRLMHALHWSPSAPFRYPIDRMKCSQNPIRRVAGRPLAWAVHWFEYRLVDVRPDVTDNEIENMRSPLKPNVESARFEPRKPSGVYLMELRSKLGGTQRIRIEISAPASNDTAHPILIRRAKRPQD